MSQEYPPWLKIAIDRNPLLQWCAANPGKSIPPFRSIDPKKPLDHKSALLLSIGGVLQDARAA